MPYLLIHYFLSNIFTICVKLCFFIKLYFSYYIVGSLNKIKRIFNLVIFMPKINLELSDSESEEE
jgi:hypothetical protein